MKNKLFILFPFFLMILVIVWAFAGMTAVSRTVRAASDFYVSTTGDDANDCLSPANACATLAVAAGKAASGDFIYIAAGTYNNTNVSIASTELTIIGDGMSSVILDGGGVDRVFHLSGATVSISGLTIRNGSAYTAGGGVWQGGGSLTLTNVRLSGNTDTSTIGGGGIFSSGPLTMTHSIVDNNQATYSGSNGGGVYLNNQSGGSMLLENVTVYGNSSGSVGGGVHNQSTMPTTLRNVTISGNNSGWAAGIAFTSSGVTTLVNVTIANNSSTNSSGPAVQNYANAVWVNSIVANNSGPDCADGGASWTSNGYNLSSDASCGFTQTGDTQNSDPLLASLDNYGGRVPTLALKLGSPAIDTGGAGSCPATDARGVSRPVDGDGVGGAVCDKGAFEFERVSSTAVVISGDSAGLANSSYTFQAAVQPITNTFPITYTWQADGQSDVVQTGSYTTTTSFSWSSVGSKTITITANNGVNSVIDTHQINITPGVQLVTSVAISGPASGGQNQAYSFTADVAPGSATTPITYTWTVDGGTPVVQTGQGTSATLSGVTFSSDGTHTIAVTADNGAGNASDSHNIVITSWYVNDASGNDANDCTSAAAPCKTIGEAIFKAASGGVIFVAAGTYSEYETGVLGKDLSILGSGAADTIVDGGGNGAVFRLQSSGSSVPDVTLADMTIRNGNRSASSGGGIYNGANLTLRRVIVENNSSLSDGGGVYNDGRTLTIVDSIIRGNTTSSSSGSALVNTGGALVISNTAVINNNGAAAALSNINGGVATLTNVTFSGNGDGISASGGTMVTAVNVTIAHNRGYGVTNDGDFNAKNSILANNGSGNCAGGSPPTTQGYNLDSGSSCGFGASGDQSNTDPQLQLLDNYGGNTFTHALPMSSPAIDAGTNTGCPAADQRGESRPSDGDGSGTATCDIGAYELIQVAPVSVTASGNITGFMNSSYTFQATTSPVTTTQPITYTWQADGQTPLTHTGKGYTDTVTFNWSSTGSKMITVTMDNGLGTQTDTHEIAITTGTQAVTGVAISGPASGSQNQAYSFTASVAPGSATTPITYTWQVDGGTPIVQTGQGTSAALSGVAFSSDGTHTISVTAGNGAGSASNSHNITIISWYADDASGSDANDCQSATTACKTIREAIYKAASGGTIFVAAGTYSENEMGVLGKDLTIIGSGAADTIVDGGGSGAVFWLQNSSGVLDITLADMTIRNGNRSASSGGGVYNTGTNLTLRRVVVENNQALGSGGGVYNDAGSLTITGSIIRGNTTSSLYGSGLVNDGGTLIISNTAVINNNGSAAALSVFNSGTVTLTNVTISGNGDGISTSAGVIVTAVNVTIAHNRGYGVTNYGAINAKNSILANNGSDNCATGSAVAPVSQGYNLDSGSSCHFNGTGDMSSTNPSLFPLAEYNGTWLHTFSASSPARDKGTNSGCPADDQAGTARPQNGTCDIGAFEYDPANAPKVNVYLPVVVRP